MLNISGFIAMNSLVLNTPGGTSKIGELTNKLESYSREKGFYKKDDYPGVRLVTFNSDLDGVLVEVPVGISDEILRISQLMFDNCISGSFSSSVELARETLALDLVDKAEVKYVGEMVTQNGYWMPESVTLALAGSENSIRLWFSAPAFRNQYDISQLLVVPPVDNVDDLLKPRTEVQDIINAVDIPGHGKKITDVVGEYPATTVSTENYIWTDRNDIEFTLKTPWSVVVYGIAGDNIDLIRNAIIDYILENSTQPRDVWETVYPDLFLPNEFFISPTWSLRSIENLQIIGGLYSPAAVLPTQLSYGTSTFFNIPISHISAYMSHRTIDYKSLGMVTIGNWKNRNGNYTLEAQWPLLVNVSSRGGDFDRMGPDTQAFYMALVTAIKVAESYNAYTVLPSGMSVVSRGTLEYLVFSHDKIQYLVSLPKNPIIEYVDPTMNPESKTEYQVNWVVPDSVGASDTNIQVQLMHKLATASEFSTLTLEDGVYWDAVWYDVTGAVIDTVELTDVGSDVVLFAQDLTGTEDTTIRLYCKYKGRVIAATHVLSYV